LKQESGFLDYLRLWYFNPKPEQPFASAVRVIPLLRLGDHPISWCILNVHRSDTQKKEATMQNTKARFALALLVPALLALSISEATAAKQSADAIRAECMRQANAAAANVPSFSPSATADRNAVGVSAYRQCARKHGIRP
jgi:hypothetical protein